MKSSLKKLALSFFAMIISFSATAQLPGDPPGDPDEPEASINMYLVFFTILLISYTFLYFKKNKKEISE